jgi:hypothetical protein
MKPDSPYIRSLLAQGNALPVDQRERYVAQVNAAVSQGRIPQIDWSAVYAANVPVLPKPSR